MAELAYPYKAGISSNTGKCKLKRTGIKMFIKCFTCATPGCDDDCDKQNEKQLKELVGHQLGRVRILARGSNECGIATEPSYPVV